MLTDTERTMEKPVVLVVEDEALIRISAAHLVEDAGFAALEASNADEATDILESRQDIVAVFTDIEMAGSMDGLGLAHAVRRRWPPIHLLMTSARALPKDCKLPENGRFIPKPYLPGQVTAALCAFFDSVVTLQTI